MKGGGRRLRVRPLYREAIGFGGLIGIQVAEGRCAANHTTAAQGQPRRQGSRVDDPGVRPLSSRGGQSRVVSRQYYAIGHSLLNDVQRAGAIWRVTAAACGQHTKVKCQGENREKLRPFHATPQCILKAGFWTPLPEGRPTFLRRSLTAPSAASTRAERWKRSPLQSRVIHPYLNASFF